MRLVVANWSGGRTGFIVDFGGRTGFIVSFGGRSWVRLVVDSGGGCLVFEGRRDVADGRSLIGIAVGWCVAGNGVGVELLSVSSLVSSVVSSVISSVLGWSLVFVDDVRWARHVHVAIVTTTSEFRSTSELRSETNYVIKSTF